MSMHDRVILQAILFSCVLAVSIAIYCDEDDCYDILGITQNANTSEIKKAYYKLSLKYHPDKNPDPESRKLFVKIANAYEILRDESTRSQYDYAIAHPEEVFYNAARYYHAYYSHKTDIRAVIVGLLVIISALEYLTKWTRYNQALEMVKKTPAYKNKLLALELEKRGGGTVSKKKGQKQRYKQESSNSRKVEGDTGDEFELQINGAERPSTWELLGVQFVLLPFTLGKLLIWYGLWTWRYKFKRLPFSFEDASYLTRKSLGLPLDAWNTTDVSTRDGLVRRRLWEKSNLNKYLAEVRKERKRR